jgi:murein peptide amidase A
MKRTSLVSADTPRRAMQLACLGVLAMGACGGARADSPALARQHHRAARRAALIAGNRSGAVRLAVVGHSVKGREILARVVGSPAATRSILVVGCVHGNERAGEAITHRLRSVTPPSRTALWLVDEFNPDGCRANTRQNARGVDLNRNSPWDWRPLEQRWAPYYSGSGPLSEPESRAINRLITHLRPAVTVWYHQHASLVDDSSGGSLAIERHYARAVGLPLRSYGFVPGSITTWQDHTFAQDTAFVVELPSGSLPASSVSRHVAAILSLA